MQNENFSKGRKCTKPGLPKDPANRKESQKNKRKKRRKCGTKDLRACWQLRPRPAPGLLTPGSPLPPRSSLVCFCAALNVFKSRAHLRNSTGSVGVGPTTALLPAPALPEIIARPSDARPAIVASRFTGVLLCCDLCLHISCPRAEPYGV